MSPMPRQPCFSAGQLESLCKSLADTDTGLSGTEIGQTLRQVGVEDPDPNSTKWRRLCNALIQRQNHDQSGDRVLAFIHAALDPVRYAGNAAVFELRCDAVNVVLAFYGIEYGEDGKFHHRIRAKTLAEAEARADRLRAALQGRSVDPEVLRYCQAELLQDNYFHAALETTKSVAAKLRELSGLSGDGAPLADATLGGSAPIVQINAGAIDTHRSEQAGFLNLVKGMFGVFRNTTAHEPRIEWTMDEEDALDLMTLASYVHRRLRKARVVSPSG
jgi:uncharacterized protein (TIGR02391 family)